jgi:hypothetical protein
MTNERASRQALSQPRHRPATAGERPSVPGAGIRMVGALPYGRAVQPEGGGAAGDVHRHAAEGVRGAPESLPYGGRIQAAFGRHDVSDVQAHVGGPAAAAARAMGASAYAVGDQVAFREAPSLHTAAHEAAHVVQQRGGVQLQGGVGAAGDAYERHADAVADAVVAGGTAEPLLDALRGGGSGAAAPSSAVQRRSAQEPAADIDRGHPENPSAVIASDTTGPDGVRRVTWDDGERAEIQPNGDVTWYRPDGSFGGSVTAGTAVAAPGGPPDAAAATPGAPPAVTPGDQVRAAIYESAQKWLNSQEEFMTKEAIDKVRGSKANYSTCRDFVSKVLGEARSATGETQDISSLVTALQALLDQEIELRAAVEADKKSEAMFDPEILRVRSEIEELQQNPKTPPARVKSLQRYLDDMLSKRATRERKTAKDQAKLDTAQQGSKAFRRATPGLPTSLRPKKGDILRIVTAETREYSVAGAAGATLQKGSFLHTAVFDRIDGLGGPNELWHTIDGGGSKATDGLSGAGTPFDPATLRFGRAALEGWIDMADLVNGNASAATPGKPAAAP